MSEIPLHQLTPAAADHPAVVLGHGHQSSPDRAEAISPQQAANEGVDGAAAAPERVTVRLAGDGASSVWV
jgi:hypothetical protein